MFPPETPVLIVEDNAVVRRNIRDILRSIGMRDILEAADGLEALKLLYARVEAGAPIGLALVDWHMPNLSGLELLVSVRGDAKLSKLPFVLITSESEMQEVVKAVQAGVNDYLMKPVSAATLTRKLQAVWKKIKG